MRAALHFYSCATPIPAALSRAQFILSFRSALFAGGVAECLGLPPAADYAHRSYSFPISVQGSRFPLVHWHDNVVTEDYFVRTAIMIIDTAEVTCTYDSWSCAQSNTPSIDIALPGTISGHRALHPSHELLLRLSF